MAELLPKNVPKRQFSIKIRIDYKCLIRYNFDMVDVHKSLYDFMRTYRESTTTILPSFTVRAK